MDWSRVNVPGVISIVVFYVIMLAIGLWAGRKKKKGGADTEEEMLAGRSIGYIIGTITMTATWVDGCYILGTAEVVATPGSGLIQAQAPVCYSLSLIVGGIMFARKMRSAGYVTMLDPFSQRFGNRMGGLLFLPALMAETFWTGAVLSALGSSIRVIIGLDNTISIVVSACFAVFYTVFGGLYSVTYTDIVQMVFIPVGLWLCFPFALNHPAVESLSVTKDQWLGTYYVASTGVYVDNILLLTLGGVPWQAYFQRVLSTKSSAKAQWMSITAGIGCFLMAIPAVCLGAVAASTDWNMTGFNETGNLPWTEYKLAVPLVMQYLCPVWVAFIGLGAVSAAVMSSADASILSASSMFARNVYKLVFRQKASEKEVVWVMRVSIVLVGALAAFMAIVVDSIYTLWYLCSDIVYVILFPHLTMVVYNKSINTYGSVCGYIIGLVFRILGGEPALGIPVTLKYPYFDEENHVQLFPFKTLAMLLDWIALVLVSYLTKYLFTTGKLDPKFDIFRCYKKAEFELEISDVTKSQSCSEEVSDGDGGTVIWGTKENLVE